jgi:hypothetical protein
MKTTLEQREHALTLLGSAALSASRIGLSRTDFVAAANNMWFVMIEREKQYQKFLRTNKIRDTRAAIQKFLKAHPINQGA